MDCNCDGITTDPLLANSAHFCDCMPNGEDWETLQPNLSRMIFELELGFMPASKYSSEKYGDSLRRALGQNIPENQRQLVERGIDILGDNAHEYCRIEVWEIDRNLESDEGYVFLMFPRGECDEPVLVDLSIVDSHYVV